MKTHITYNIFSLLLFASITALAITTTSFTCNAQTDNKDRLLQMIQDDPATIEAIASTDDKVIRHTLQIARTPEVFDKMSELQKRSQQQFRNIIQDYDRTDQEAFYDLARYPNLITELVRNGRPSTEEAIRIASNYPDNLHETAVKYSRSYFDVLVRIDRLNDAIDQSFQQYLEPYNPKTRESVNVLLSHPEIISALVEDMSFTSLLGEVYGEDPEWLINRLNRISSELAQQNREDLDNYKTQIQNDPEAYNELLEASDRYARETNDHRSYDNSSDPFIEINLINSYPYWFGYPYWYSSPIWRPYPTYYHTGFYRNRFGRVVFTGLPSMAFLHWHTHYHPNLFPHLSYNYYNYYNRYYSNRPQGMGHRIANHGFYKSIEANVMNNPRVNNSSMHRIDQQRGNNIIRQPNTSMSNSTRRGVPFTIRQSGNTYSRPGSVSRGTLDRRGYETNTSRYNQQKSAGAINNGGDNRTNSNRSRMNTDPSTNQRSNSTEQRQKRSMQRQPSVSSPSSVTERPSRAAQTPARTSTREKARAEKSAPLQNSNSSTTTENKDKSKSGRR